MGLSALRLRSLLGSRVSRVALPFGLVQADTNEDQHGSSVAMLGMPGVRCYQLSLAVAACRADQQHAKFRQNTPRTVRLTWNTNL